MQLIDISLPVKEVNIEIFADLHLGSKKCNIPLIQARLHKVLTDPNTYAVLLGDLINNSTKTSVGDTYTEELSPMEQMQLAVRLFEPIKDKILAITSGNHERRSYKKEGVDLMYFLAAQLGLEDRYDYCSNLIFLRLDADPGVGTGKGSNNPQLFTIYQTHGDGNGGRTVGGKANGLQRRGDIVDADVVITGHTHMPLSFRQCGYRIDRTHRRLIKHEQLFVNASATLDYEEYAELYGMRPSSTVSPVLHLGSKGSSVTI